MQQNEGLVTVDEVGGDEDPFLQAVKDLQALVTLDEIVEENEEPSSEPFPFGMGDDTGDAFNPEALLTLDETPGDDEAEGEAKTASPAKSTGSPATHEGLLTLDETQGDDEDAPEEGPEKPVASPSLPAAETDEEECRGLEELQRMNFVTVDEVGEEEEEQPPPPQEKEVDPDPEPAVRGGRPKKRGRQTPVRKSTRGQKAVPAKEEEKKKSAPESCSVVNSSDSRSPGPAEVPEPQTRNTEASTDVPDIKSLQSVQDTQSNGDKVLPEDSHDSQRTTDPTAATTEESKLRREGEDDSTEGPDSKKARTESPSLQTSRCPPSLPTIPLAWSL
ncbi:hypothetical protein GJAV_G00168260 [Gymnothorax javanicus]|nr:hypothetical protein GJAV_G00168260 [Gymnothorax javanicus]